MYFYNGSLIELPKKGKAMVVTDIHGNMDDLDHFITIWEDFKSKHNHMIFTGDFIHAMGLEDDKSIDVVIKLRKLFNTYKNVHILLGNHEWSVISNTILYKGGKNLSLNFESLLKRKYGGDWRKMLDKCIDCFKKLPIAVRTDNKVFISHAGPPKKLTTLEDIAQIKNGGYVNNQLLFDFLWNRYDDYGKKDIEKFLDSVKCNAMIVGHTPVNGVKLIGKNQLIVSSSYTEGKKAFVELDLEKKVTNGKDILKMIKYID